MWSGRADRSPRCACIAALGVAIVYGEAERVVVLALVGGGITFAILSTRP